MDLRNHLDEKYGKGVYGFSEITIEKVNNAKDKYANNVSLEDVVLLIDDTVFGSGKCGVLITFDGLYIGEDFEKPVYFGFDKIQSVYMKKNVLVQSLCINDRKVKNFTQPEYRSLKSVFEKLDVYISYYNSGNRYIAIKDLPNTIDKAEEVHTNSAENINKLKNGDVNNQASKGMSNLLTREKESTNSTSEFGIIESYVLYEAFKELKKLSDRGSMNSSLLLGNHRNPQMKIESIVKEFIIENSILIRDKVLYGKGSRYFLDDLAFKECIILACSFLKFEFERVGFPTNYALEILDVGLKSIFKSNDEIIFDIKESMDILIGASIEAYIYSFYVRIYILNTSLNYTSDFKSTKKYELIQSIVLSSLLRSANEILGARDKILEIATKLDMLMGKMPVLGLEMSSNKAVKELTEIINNFR